MSDLSGGYVLDTDVISDLAKRRPCRETLSWLSATDSQQIGIPSAVIGEIRYGVEVLRTRGMLAEALGFEIWLEGFLRVRENSILSADTEIGWLQARMFSDPCMRNFIYPDPKSKKPKVGVDLIVAATAIVLDRSVVTYNIADFSRIHVKYPLPGLFQPCRSEWIVPAKLLPQPTQLCLKY